MTNKQINDKQINEIYRDFSGMAHSKSISEIANWLDIHKGYELINLNKNSVTFTFEKCDLLVSITSSGDVNIKKDYYIDLLTDTRFLEALKG